MIDKYKNGVQQPVPVELDPTQLAPLQDPMPIPVHDQIVLAYTDGNLTSVTYKLDGVTVGTKTLTYTDGNLTGVSVS